MWYSVYVCKHFKNGQKYSVRSPDPPDSHDSPMSLRLIRSEMIIITIWDEHYCRGVFLSFSSFVPAVEIKKFQLLKSVAQRRSRVSPTPETG